MYGKSDLNVINSSISDYGFHEFIFTTKVIGLPLNTDKQTLAKYIVVSLKMTLYYCIIMIFVKVIIETHFRYTTSYMFEEPPTA